MILAAAVFLSALGLVSAESAVLTLLPATFVVLFVVTVASLRRS